MVIDAQRSLRFTAEASAVFDQFRHARDVEHGGILLGRVYPSQIVVERVTMPTKRDRAGRFWFHRSRDAAQGAVDVAWAASGGECIYLGEWHSHPAAIAEPSGRDRQMVLNMLRQTTMEIDYLLLAVIGQKEDWIGLAHQGSIRRLVQIEIASDHPG